MSPAVLRSIYQDVCLAKAIPTLDAATRSQTAMQTDRADRNTIVKKNGTKTREFNWVFNKRGGVL